MTRRPNIIEAIKNPKLFGSLPRFKKLDTWLSWLVVLKAIFGLAIRRVAQARGAGVSDLPKSTNFALPQATEPKPS